MATRGQKIQKAAEAAAKAEKCIIKKGLVEVPGPAALGETVMDAYNHYSKIKIEKELLTLCNDKISLGVMTKFLDDSSGTVNVICGGVKCTVAVSEKTVIKDPEKLKTILGDRFDDLVKVKTTYAPYERLIEIIESGDHEEIEAILECIQSADKKARISYSPASMS